VPKDVDFGEFDTVQNIDGIERSHADMQAHNSYLSDDDDDVQQTYASNQENKFVETHNSLNESYHEQEVFVGYQSDQLIDINMILEADLENYDM